MKARQQLVQGQMKSYVSIDKNASLDVYALNATLIIFFDKLFFIVLIFAIILHLAWTKMPNTITNSFENET